MRDASATNQQKIHAKLLYTKHDYNITDTALETGTDEATVRNWIMEGAWDTMKLSLLTSKTAQVQRYYRVIEYLDSKLKSDDEITVKHADLIAKYTTCIKNLQEETGTTEMIEMAEQFTIWLRRTDTELTQEVALHLDAFIKQKLSSLAS